MSTALDHQRVFQTAWEDPRHTQIEMPPTDVNRRLSDRYTTDPPVSFTREMLWDNEVRKAWRPDVYVPSEFSEAKTWGAREQSDGTECFLRSTLQLLWLERNEYGRVLEQVHLDHPHQKVTFIGAAQLEDRDGEPLRAGQGQPVFYVEHSVGGDQSQPMSMWRIVHLTNTPDQRLVHAFAPFAKSPWLDEFVETYIEKNLGARLTRVPVKGKSAGRLT
jgi:hypothetical protein